MKRTLFLLLFSLLSSTNISTAQRLEIDGSSTVFPLTKAVVTMYQRSSSAAKVNLMVSGTGGGFKRFVKGETDINNSSRKPNEKELSLMRANGVSFYELPLAQDGIALVVNKRNNFVQELTIAELQLIWTKGSTIKTWNDLRDEWPAQPIKLYGPGLSSGTREFFGEYLFSSASQLRDDYQMSEDDDELEKLVENDKNALCFFGVAYVARNNDQVKIVGLSIDDQVLLPSYSTIKSHLYPLSRTLYLHINEKSLSNSKSLNDFLNVYIRSLTTLSKAAGYIPLDARIYKKHLVEINDKSSFVLSR